MALALAVGACSSAATPAPSAAPTSAATPASSSSALVNVALDPALGAYLTGAGGKSLYLFTKDSKDTSSCAGDCATNWPPLLVQGSEAPTGGAGVTGTLATLKRDDGTTQVTYNGVPLYYWAKDTKAGDTTGQGVNGVWFLASPQATAVEGGITGGVQQPGGAATPAATNAPSGATSDAVTIANFAFAPADLTVTVGATVKWTNTDGVSHTVTATDGSFDSKNLSQGQTFTQTFTTAGTYTYICTIHTSMKAQVKVVEVTSY